MPRPFSAIPLCRSGLVALTLATGLAGCAPTAPSVEASAPAAPAHWRADGASPAGPVRIGWPALFGSPELTRLTRIATAGNFDLDAAAARILQADAQAVIAGASLYPHVSGEADASRSRTPGTLRSSAPPFQASYGGHYQLGLSASYVLDFWGHNRKLAEAAGLDAQAARFDYEVVAVSTVVAVSAAYFQLLVAQDRVRIARENIRSAERILTAFRARLAVGTASALDIAQQEAVIANLRASVPAFEQQAEQQRNLIAVLLGRAPEAMRVRGGSLRALAVPTPRPGLPAQLLLRRPDISAAETRLKSANANIEAARAAFFPTISLTGAASLQSAALKNLLRPEALALSAAAGLTQPIFEGYSLAGQFDAAQGRAREILAVYRKAIVTSFSDVENALIAVRKTAEAERLRAAAVAAAARAYAISEQRLREGAIDIVTLLNVQQTLFSAQDALSLARYNRLVASMQLFQALGGGFSRDDEAPMIGASL